MSSHPTTADDRSPLVRLLALRREVVRALADPVRAASVSALLERGRPTSLDALVETVAERGDGAALADVGGPGRSRREVRDSLALHHLPILADAGLVAFDRDEGTARPTDHPAVTRGLVDPSLLRSLPSQTWQVAERLADVPARRRVVTVLADDPGPFDLRRLVAASSPRSVAVAPGVDAREDVAERTATGLHHVHLPVLDDVGLLAYDAANHVVERAPNPPVEYDRLAAAIVASVTDLSDVVSGVDGADPSSGDPSTSDADDTDDSVGGTVGDSN
jgi:DNA-binding transcriptional ArsR family regulator